jgi:hypothetical protein
MGVREKVKTNPINMASKKRTPPYTTNFPLNCKIIEKPDFGQAFSEVGNERD